MNRVVINGVDCSPDVLARERKVYEDMARGYLEAKAEADGLRLAVGAAAKDRDEAVRAEQEIRGAWLGWRERARLAEARAERLEKALCLVLTDYRTEGCGDPTCAVCARSAAAKAEARAAILPPPESARPMTRDEADAVEEIEGAMFKSAEPAGGEG